MSGTKKALIGTAIVAAGIAAGAHQAGKHWSNAPSALKSYSVQVDKATAAAKKGGQAVVDSKVVQNTGAIGKLAVNSGVRMSVNVIGNPATTVLGVGGFLYAVNAAGLYRIGRRKDGKTSIIVKTGTGLAVAGGLHSPLIGMAVGIGSLAWKYMSLRQKRQAIQSAASTANKAASAAVSAAKKGVASVRDRTQK